jgi:Heterokaryon incompatibility protein (HET)
MVRARARLAMTRSSSADNRLDATACNYFWVDTCCIDKSNNNEPSEAINSMFRWYRNAAKCYVYLSDVPRPAFDTNDKSNQLPWESAFWKSRWFTRGWTLQELIAPASVEFSSKDWEQLGLN